MFTTTLRLLTFRLTLDEYRQLGVKHLLFGLATAWLVGYGRWWDRPDKVEPLLRYGLLSVIIVLALGLVIQAVIRPLTPRCGGLLQTTAYASLTSLPAAVYALPLERWMGLESARAVDVGLLMLVAIWRVGLYVNLVVTIAGLRNFTAFVVALVPLSTVVFALTISGFLMGVLRLMTGDGFDAPPPSTAETRYELIAWFGMISVVVGPLAFVAWVTLCVMKIRRQRSELAPPSDSA